MSKQNKFGLAMLLMIIAVVLEKDPCWQWKNDSGEWIDPDVVNYWKGLEE